MSQRLHYSNIFFIGLIHLGALAAIPFFSWSALGVCLLLLFTITPIGINLCYHRLLTHRAFKVPLWLEHVFATVAAFSSQGPMLIWVAEHRLHHAFSDTEKDPHSPIKGFFHAHMGHLFRKKDFEDDEKLWLKYVPDLASDKYYLFLNKYHALFVASLIPLLYLWGGLPFVLWGVFVRIVLMWHITWCVNSASHTWGYRTYDTKDTSTNCWWVGVLATGEGWHNNHHAFPSCAAHGREWWELDLTYVFIRTFEWLGLATDVRKPVRSEPVLQPSV